jgi:hypothetical protein
MRAPKGDGADIDTKRMMTTCRDKFMIESSRAGQGESYLFRWNVTWLCACMLI